MRHFLAKIIEGKLNFQSDYNEARFRQFCADNEGKIVRIEQDRPIRSLSQNALYWVWLAKVELETGSSSEDLHEYLKSVFLPRRLIRIKGKAISHDVETLGSTTKLNKVEFGEYLEKCAAHCGIPLPTVEEIEEMGYLPK